MPERNDIDPVERAIGGLPMRSIGPALMGGRIADIAIHPSDLSTWYVGVGSGGVWKTINSGITWSPVFDDETSYSIGCVRIDPTHPEVVWVGTGEAVSGRHVAWGDGVYKSIDAGNSWTRMGLEHSEHVSDILIDPRHGDTVYVAAEGPLWSSGGERGLYKTTDSGETWVRVLYVDDDTGVTSAVFAPDDPDTIYAAPTSQVAGARRCCRRRPRRRRDPTPRQYRSHRLDEATTPSIRALVDRVVKLHRETTAPPTQTQRDMIKRARLEFEAFEARRDQTLAEIDAITAQLDAAGGPWTAR